MSDSRNLTSGHTSVPVK